MKEKLPKVIPPRDAVCLSFWQPWAHLICFWHKNVENRSWRPGPKYIGHHFWIHAAARRMTEDEREDFADEWPELEHMLDEMSYGAIVGRSRLEGVYGNFDSEWATKGSLHWHLTERLACEPIPHRGKQGLWPYRAEEAA